MPSGAPPGSEHDTARPAAELLPTRELLMRRERFRFGWGWAATVAVAFSFSSMRLGVPPPGPQRVWTCVLIVLGIAGVARAMWRPPASRAQRLIAGWLGWAALCATNLLPILAAESRGTVLVFAVVQVVLTALLIAETTKLRRLLPDTAPTPSELEEVF